MRVPILRVLLCWILLAVVPASLLGQALPAQSGGAILHTQGGGVWVNGYEARDSSAVFAGDLLETKSGATANLTLDGSTVMLAPESVAKFQGNLLELDHGSVSVGTSKSFKVRVNCIRVIPVLSEWTQYVVTNVSGDVQVAAHKLDVNVEHELGRGKPAPANQSTQRASVHEGHQDSYQESEICGAPAGPSSASSMTSPKWIAAGAAGAGVLVFVLVRGGGGKHPISSSQP